MTGRARPNCSIEAADRREMMMREVPVSRKGWSHSAISAGYSRLWCHHFKAVMDVIEKLKLFITAG